MSNTKHANWWNLQGYAGDFEQSWAEWAEKNQPNQDGWSPGVTEVKCECGAHVTYGSGCDGWLHSRWCCLFMDNKEKK